MKKFKKAGDVPDCRGKFCEGKLKPGKVKTDIIMCNGCRFQNCQKYFEVNPPGN